MSKSIPGCILLSAIVLIPNVTAIVSFALEYGAIGASFTSKCISVYLGWRVASAVLYWSFVGATLCCLNNKRRGVTVFRAYALGFLASALDAIVSIPITIALCMAPPAQRNLMFFTACGWIGMTYLTLAYFWVRLVPRNFSPNPAETPQQQAMIDALVAHREMVRAAGDP